MNPNRDRMRHEAVTLDFLAQRAERASNYPKAKWIEFEQVRPPSYEEIQGAVQVDANEFATSYPELGKSASWYFNDFIGRL